MTAGIHGLRLSNILVLGFDRIPQPTMVGLAVSPQTSLNDSTLKALIQQGWIKAGKPRWDLEDTIKQAISADLCLEG
jgi:hypothetical protein